MAKYVKLSDVLIPLSGTEYSGYRTEYLRKYYNNLPTVEIEEEKKEFPEFNWKPYYPNNMKINRVEGYYCIVSTGADSARKYTIKFEYKEEDIKTGLINPSIIVKYVLFEKTYSNVKGPKKYPEPVDEGGVRTIIHTYKDNDTFNGKDYNDFGSYVRCYDTVDDAKQRVYTQLKAIEYAKSFM